MIGILGKKIGMTSIYDADGRNIPCTVIQAGPCVVTQVKSKESDGYEAVQLAFGERKEKSTPAAMKGHFTKANTSPKRKLAEFKGFEKELKIGEEVTVEMLSEGQYCDVIGVSKGKGFQGVVRRHGFAGVGGQTHGQHNRLRAPGSLGASSFPSRVLKGMRMAGRMGTEYIKTSNLQIVKVIPEQHLVLVKGSVPGAKGSYLTIEI